MQVNSNLIVGALVVLAIIVVIVFALRRRKDTNKDVVEEQGADENEIESPVEQPPVEESAGEEKEGFTLATDAYVDPITGVIKGNRVMTTGFSRSDPQGYVDSVKENGSINDTMSGDLNLIDNESNLDKAYVQQQEIYSTIPQDSELITHADQQKIARTAQPGSNKEFNLFARSGGKNLNMNINPLGVKAVIDEKYIPERDRHGNLEVVGTVIPVQGFDINIERMSETYKDIHFNTINPNRRGKRIPTAAGATTEAKMPTEEIVKVDEEVDAMMVKMPGKEDESIRIALDEQGTEVAPKENFVAGMILV